jgi:hypothetical protein
MEFTDKTETPKSNTVWISMDYDGCGDVMRPDFPEAYIPFLKPVKEALRQHISNITSKYTKTILASGSARQSVAVNRNNMMNNNNGCSFTNLEFLAKELNAEIYKGLLADDYSDNSQWGLKKAKDNIPYMDDGDIKVALISKQMKECNKQGITEFHFYDDREDLLQFVIDSGIAKKHNINLYAWHWNWTPKLNDQLELARQKKEGNVSKPELLNPVVFDVDVSKLEIDVGMVHSLRRNGIETDTLPNHKPSGWRCHLSRLENIMTVDNLPPIEIRAKHDYFEIFNGRHRTVKAIIQGQTHIKAKLV